MFLLFAFLTPIHSLFCVLRYLSLLSLKLPLGKDCFWSISLSLFSELVLALIREPTSTSSRSSANDFTSLCLGFLNYKSQNNTSSFPRELWWELNAILLKMYRRAHGKQDPFLFLSLNDFIPHPRMVTVSSWSGDLSFVKIYSPWGVQKWMRHDPPYHLASPCLGGPALTAEWPNGWAEVHEQNSNKSLSTVTAAPRKKLIKGFFLRMSSNQRGHGWRNLQKLSKAASALAFIIQHLTHCPYYKYLITAQL